MSKNLTRQEKSDLLGRTIRANSATPQGFSVDDCPQAAKTKAAHQRCRLMVIAGTLFKARVHYRLIRYFSTAEAAKAFMHANRHEATERAGPALTLTPTFAERSFLSRAGAKPRSQQAPKLDVEIIYPPGYRHTVVLMPPPRNQVVKLPFIHGGMGQMK